MAAADYYTQVYTMFVGYFGRPPAQSGLDNYANLVDKAGGNLAVVIDDFFKSDESKAFFNGKSVEQQINQIFQNLFGRDALPAGLNYWAGQINSGAVALSQAAYTIAFNAAAADVAVRDAKIASAKAWVAGLDTTAEILAFGTDGGRAAGRDFLKTVTTSTPATQTAVDAALKAMVDGGANNPGQTYTLTQNVDNIQGTNGDDTIIAGPGSAGGVHTLGASDVINGGSGNDKIIITSQAPVAGENLVPRITSVEQVLIQAVGAGNTTVNMINATGSKEVWSDNSTSTVFVSNLQEKATIGVKGGNGGNSMGVQAAAPALTGDLAVALNGANAAVLAVNATGVLGAAGYTSTTINTTVGNDAITGRAGTQTSQLALLDVGNALNKVTVTGDGAVRVAANLANTVRTIDASANKGGVNFNIANNTGNVTFTGGDGNDRINFGGTLNLQDKVGGGAGRDILGVNDQSFIIPGLQVSNVEVLELNTLNATLNAALIAGVDEVRVTTTLNNGTVNGLTSNSTFVTNAAGNATLNLVNAQVAGTNDTLNLKTGLIANGAVNVMAGGVENIAYTDNVTANTGRATTVNFFDTDGVVDVTNLTLAGNAGNTVNFNGLVNTIRTVDGSASMGSTNVSIAAGNPTNGVTIKGGAQASMLTGGDGKDVITGGAGNDRIQGDANVGIAQITKVAAGTTDVGDTYTLSINGTVVTVEATAANGNNVEALLAAAINGNAIITAQGITADASSGDLLINGNPNGTAFTVANTNSTNAAARAEISTIALTSGADDGDTYRVTIGNTGTLADKNYATAFAADATPAQARAAIITTLNADADFVAAGFTAALNGAGEIEVTGPVGNDFTLAINEQVPAAPTAQVDTITFNVADLDAGDIFTVTIGSVSANYTMTGNNTVDGVGVQNAVNAALGTTVTAAYVDNGVANFDAGDQLTITAGTAGTAFNATIKVNGVGAASTINTTTPNDPVTSLVATVIETQAALAAGANVNSAANLTVTQQQAPVLGGTPNSDTLTGGDGNDVFVFVGQTGGWNSSALTNMDTITDLNLGGTSGATSVDTIQLSSAVLGYGAFNASSLVNAGGAVTITGPTFNAALQGLFNAGGALAGATNNVGLFTYGADTYLIAANSTIGLDANDIVIKVTGATGTLDLSDIAIV